MKFFNSGEIVIAKIMKNHIIAQKWVDVSRNTIVKKSMWYVIDYGL